MCKKGPKLRRFAEKSDKDMADYLGAHADHSAVPVSLFADVLERMADKSDDDLEREFNRSKDEDTNE